MKRTFLDQKAKEALRKGVRGLRERLIGELTESVQSEYQLGIAADKAKLSAERREKRRRLELSLEERARTAPKAGQGKQSKQKSGEVDATELRLAATEAAHTLLNRLAFLRILEHHGVLKPALVTGGWESPAFEQEFAHYGAEFKDEPSRGYLQLLDAVYAEYALDLPALFGPVGVTTLFPIPVPTLRAVLELLSDPALDSAWGDDTALGWIYQFWNDPERERLDEKIAGGGKIEPHELGPKTQMFTERYMVEWLLHNTLGQTWLAMCKKHGWTADFDQVREPLEARRAAFRKRREAGEVPLDALMPIEGELEEHWKYWVPQPLPDEAVAAAPETLRDLKLLDPACGSGHFLVIAFDLLAALYEEEARHRGETWSPTEIAQSIIERNLHGIDIDARAIQLSAAALWLKAKLYAPKVELSRMNLVAPIFRLGALPKDDPSLVQLCDELARFVVPKDVTLKLVEALSGVDHLGTLLRVDDEIAELLKSEERKDEPLLNYSARKKRVQVLDRLTDFLDEHAAEADLGLRLEGEQLEAGMRFVAVAKQGSYDIVVGNPPYQGTSKMAQAGWFKKHYPKGKADLYACFLERGLELAKPGGVSALLTMRGWMFLSQFQELREHLLKTHDLQLVGDIDRGGFTDIPDEVVSTTMAVFARATPDDGRAVAVQPTPLDDRSRDADRTLRKRAALLAQVGRYEFDVAKLSGIDGTPLVYWWDERAIARYVTTPKLGETYPVSKGITTCNDIRFTRSAWEVRLSDLTLEFATEALGPSDVRRLHTSRWLPWVNGANGRAWQEPVIEVLRWENRGIELANAPTNRYGRGEQFYFRAGIAFSMIGAGFLARGFRFRGIHGNKGSSVFPPSGALENLSCLLNSTQSRNILASLNPGIGTEVGDVVRLPVTEVRSNREIFETCVREFTRSESHREPSVEFRSPGPSPWRYAQAWAQLAVDRAEDEALPPYEAELDPPDPITSVSFAIGVALGRFGANAEGILNEAPADALPAGILYLTSDEGLSDSLKHPAAQRIVEAWKEHAPAILQGKRQSLSEWLKKDFFKYHLDLYENRPIYFPLASSQKSFVAFISIHRWTDSTLQDLLALHLAPALRQLAGEIADLNKDRASSDKAKSSAAEKQFTRSKRLHDELADFIARVTECAERGAPPTDATCPPRAQDAKFRMDLDDGVMINSAALWPLLEPLWPKPKAWWKELCQAKGRKDYDWSHLARRYFRARVEEKCKQDPSLGVAHGCFWRYHPAKAYAWEFRLQHEIKPTFTIDEPDSDTCRARFLAEHADEAAAIREKEQIRRDRAEKKKLQAEEDAPDSADGDSDEASEDDDA
ncbi:MAG TPA: BREX-6 system adenine-specific DNA-methyltransferase PglX [Polyangiaceae bacterium]|nr:BREX-6 system adenine-specific DNA-methyltransferase PglX [Polyangiaceae bacterium]